MKFILAMSNCTKYFKDENYTILHREDGPAIEYSNGEKRWYVNGDLHREDGPAVENSDGYRVWYLNGKNFVNIKSNEYWVKFVKTLILI